MPQRSWCALKSAGAEGEEELGTAESSREEDEAINCARDRSCSRADGRRWDNTGGCSRERFTGTWTAISVLSRLRSGNSVTKERSTDSMEATDMHRALMAIRNQVRGPSLTMR